MELTLNGEKRELPEGMSVSRLLETLRIAPERVVVEVNLTILKRAEHPQTMLKAEDHVEIVQLVGGGSSDHRPQTRDRRPEMVLSPVSCLRSSDDG